MTNTSTPENPDPDAPATAPDDAAAVDAEVKYRPAGWVVESTMDDQVMEVSEPHAARALAEASARELTE